jgi:trehalose 6-phosphate synthase
VLSRFTGAAEELEGALLVNPFFLDAFAGAICTALDMPLDERRQRMAALRDALSRATIDDWLTAILSAAEEAAPIQASAEHL